MWPKAVWPEAVWPEEEGAPPPTRDVEVAAAPARYCGATWLIMGPAAEVGAAQC